MASWFRKPPALRPGNTASLGEDGTGPIRKWHLVLLAALHSLGQHHPEAMRKLDLRPAGKAHFAASRRRQNGELQRPRRQTRQRTQFHYEARQLGVGQRGVMLTAGPVSLGQHVLEDAPPERGVLARAQL